MRGVEQLPGWLQACLALYGSFYLVLAALAGFASWQRLGVTTDIGVLFDARLPWKQRDAELKRLFPQFADLLVVKEDDLFAILD